MSHPVNTPQENTFIRNAFIGVVVWIPLVPLLVLDLAVELYHRLCFPLYRMPYVDRRKYIQIDRHRLEYLNLLEKIGCVYCGYANGLLRYSAAIAGITELYWCDIRHQKRQGFIEPEHHKTFLVYGDEAAFNARHRPSRETKI